MGKAPYSKEETFTEETSKMICLMESYSISDKMARIIKVNGNRIKNMEKVFILGLMEAFMRETTKMV